MSLDRLLCLPLPFFLPLLTPLSAMYKSTCGDTLWVSVSTSSSSASHAVLSIFHYTSWCKSFPLGSEKCGLLTYFCFCVVSTIGVNHFRHHSIRTFCTHELCVNCQFISQQKPRINADLCKSGCISIHAASSTPDDSTVKPGGI